MWPLVSVYGHCWFVPLAAQWVMEEGHEEGSWLTLQGLREKEEERKWGGSIPSQGMPPVMNFLMGGPMSYSFHCFPKTSHAGDLATNT